MPERSAGDGQEKEGRNPLQVLRQGNPAFYIVFDVDRTIEDIKFILSGRTAMSEMSDWIMSIDDRQEYYILKKDKMSDEYLLVRKPLSKKGPDRLMEYFTAESDATAVEHGEKLARKFGLKV